SYKNGGNTIDAVVNNSILYRGYYFDRDLGLYYLISRYYDPNTGRFISPDDLSYLGANGDLSSYNLYAYCSNNPIMYVDPTGHSIISTLIIGAIIGAVIGGGVNFGTQLYHNGGNFEDIDWGSVVNSSIVGGALGSSLVLGVTYLGPVLSGAATFSSGATLGAFGASVGFSAIAGGSGYVLQEVINGRSDEITLGNVLGHAGVVAVEGAYNFGVGGLVGSIGNVGTKGPVFSKEWIGKILLGQEFSLPLRYPLDLMRKGLWR
ncbi:MAG: RHS repeat-associated core domain-containing protein, partial [Clostridia bacterium]|nr:RHS repeat-associated core domain-containing protein [Clostridia bacterium]